MAGPEGQDDKREEIEGGREGNGMNKGVGGVPSRLVVARTATECYSSVGLWCSKVREQCEV